MAAPQATEDGQSSSEAQQARFSSKLELALSRAAGFAARRRYPVAAVWLCAVAASFEGYSKQKPLWADELVFRWVAMQPTVHDIWSALKVGVNPDPPLGQLLTHGLIRLFGAGPDIVRLSSTCGICIMLLFLFLTLQRFVGPIYASLGLILPFCTTIVDYGVESRPYGLLYGCLAISIYCWARLGEGRINRIPLNLAFGVALAATLACHFYAVFVLPAFFFGETLRSIRRRRVSWLTFAVLAAATLTEACYWPIISNARRYSHSYFDKVYLLSVTGMADSSLNRVGVSIFSLLALGAIYFTLFGFRFSAVSEADEGCEAGLREFIALGLGLLLIPVLAWIAGFLVLKAFVSRYVLHGLFGVFLLLPVFSWRVFRQRRTAALALLFSFGIQALLYVAVGVARLAKAPDPNVAAANGASPADLALIDRALPGLKGDLVVSDLLLSIQLASYSPELRDRCIYLWDQGKDLKYTGQDSTSNWAQAIAQLGRLRVESWSGYNADQRLFLYLTTPDGGSDGYGWVRGYIEENGREGNILMRVGKYVIVEAKPALTAPVH